jgi:hypothetical protein
MFLGHNVVMTAKSLVPRRRVQDRYGASNKKVDNARTETGFPVGLSPCNYCIAFREKSNENYDNIASVTHWVESDLDLGSGRIRIEGISVVIGHRLC